jgi:hypothetical protein
MPVSPVDRMADKNRIVGKNGGLRRRRRTRGRWPKTKKQKKAPKNQLLHSFVVFYMLLTY